MYKPKFSWNFIQAIANWQNYGAADKSVVKDLLALKIDNKYKQCQTPIYRLIGLPPEQKIVTAHIGSWTTDLETAKEFIKSNWWEEFNDAREKAAIILKVQPKLSNIIVNLSLLWADNDFRKAIKFYESKGKRFNEGLDFENSQSEVVYNSVQLNSNSFFLKWDIKEQKWKKKSTNLIRELVEKLFFEGSAEYMLEAITHSKVKSSNLYSVGYDSKSKVLQIKFRGAEKNGTGGGTYEYYDVQPSVFKRLLAAKSKGKFLHKNIKFYFDYKRIS